MSQPAETRVLKRWKCEIELSKGKITFKDCILCRKTVCEKRLDKTEYTFTACILENFF